MAEFDFESLSQKYKNFVNCAAKITIDGTNLEDQAGTVRNVTVEVTAHYGASTCNFEIAAGEGAEHKGDKYQLTDSLRNTLKLGNIVEVELGYGGDKGTFKKVFKGYIDAVEMRFSQEEGYVVIVDCLDAKGIMMNSYKSGIKKDIKTFSEAVEKTLKEYSAIANKRTVTATDELTVPIEQHNESDYEFVVRIAKKLGYGFYIVNGEIFFEPVGSQDAELIEVEAGPFLVSFSLRKTLEKMVSKVIARNNNEQEPDKAFEGTADSYDGLAGGSVSPTSDLSKLLSKSVTRTVIDPSINSNDEATAIAKATLNRLSLNVAQGEMTIVGLPEIVPGKFLTVKGFGEEYDRKYFITGVTHTMNASGYFTTCALGGNKV